MREGKYIVAKDIPLDRKGEKKILKGTEILFSRGGFYLGNTLLTQDFQQDFMQLLEHESVNGWNYLCPIVTRTGDSLAKTR